MTFTESEVHFLACWTSEVLKNRWKGPAHQLQQHHGATGADLGVMVAAWSRDTKRPQATIADLHTEGTPVWPWSSPERFRSRVIEARQLFEQGESR